MTANYIKALLDQEGRHWNNGGKVGGISDMGDGVSLTYSFMTSLIMPFGWDEYPGFQQFSGKQKGAIRQGIQHFSDIANISFSEGINSSSNLKLGFVNLPSEDTNKDGKDDLFILGVTHKPSQSGVSLFIDRGGVSNEKSTDMLFEKGSWEYSTLLHELGHAVGGLNDVTIGRNPTDPVSNKKAYEKADEDRNKGLHGTTLNEEEDNNKYTIMSYNSHPDMPRVEPRTLMLYDIAALQTLYGANKNHNSGNTVYRYEKDETFIETIWDGGGIDTIYADEQTRDSVINLQAGEFSSIGSLNGTRDAKDNLAIAYGVTIENAVGGSGDDRLLGNNASNFLYGGGGHDYLRGYGGNDTMYGGDGNDLYFRENLGDVIVERDYESGVDTIYTYLNYNAASGLQLEANVENLQLGGSATYATGNGLNNTITANASNRDSFLYGEGGEDTLIGNAGNDSLYGGEGSDILRGGAGDDYLRDGGSGRNYLYGGADNDTFYGGGDNYFYGETGDDIYYVGSRTDRIIERAGEGEDTVRVYHIDNYTLPTNVENIEFQAGSVKNATGNSLNNRLIGNRNDNVLKGGAGDDYLRGMGGKDHLYGGADNDTFYGDGAGEYFFYGETGDDIYYVGSRTDRIIERAGEGEDTVRVYHIDNYTLPTNVENIEFQAGSVKNATGNSLNNRLMGNGNNNILRGEAGNDYLRGYGGSDKMYGGTGNDLYFVHTGGDQVFENANEGIDTVYTYVNYNTASGRSLEVNVERLKLGGNATHATGNGLNNIIWANAIGKNSILDGGDGNDRLLGYSQANRTGNETMYGGKGNDYLRGYGGNDKMYGGTGNDLYFVHTSGDQVFENANEGIDTVYTYVNYNTASGRSLEVNVERLKLGGNATHATGNGLNNIIWANASGKNSHLDGEGGNDLLLGRAGADVLTGGMGNDTLKLGKNDNSADQVNYQAGDGRDRVFEFVRGLGQDRLNFSDIPSIDVRTVGSDTQFRIANTNFGNGSLLLTTIDTNGFTIGDVGVSLTGATFNFS